MKNEIIETNIFDIEKLIYEIDGKEVMLDSDLAKLYGCRNGTKEINQAVKNNPEKFPSRYSFILSNNEKKDLWSKFLTANISVKLEVNVKDETVWLNQEQMSKLFGKAKSTINEHIKNIYLDNELDEIETMTKFGNSEFSDKPTNYYNLDMIISVGYRVNSKQGIAFRKWATSVLKDHLIKGYSVNQKRLDYLEKKVQFLILLVELKMI